MNPMPTSDRLSRAFARREEKGRPALVAYLTAGDPGLDRTVELALAMERGGADVLELGVPFSDPIADGPVIQRASERALKAGTNVRKVLAIAKEIRSRSEMPIILFSYLNPLLSFGFEKLSKEAAAAGVDGCLLTDVSVEEAEEPVGILSKEGLSTVFLAAPTSTDRRLALVGKYSSGFVYVVSRTGVTGEQESVEQGVEPLVKRLRQFTDLPLAVGFGVSKPEHFSAIGKYAEGVVVGSAFMRLIEQYGSAPDLAARLEEFTRNLTGAPAVAQ
jgi:tryptophan synthase alpha chain